MRTFARLAAIAVVLAGCSSEPQVPSFPKKVTGDVDVFGGLTESRKSENECGPYFVGYPEATENLKIDVVIFKMKRQDIAGMDTLLLMTATRDRLIVVVDDTKKVPFVTIDPPNPTEIRISKDDLENASCLKRSGTPGSRI